jgi:hypothetical protein
MAAFELLLPSLLQLTYEPSDATGSCPGYSAPLSITNVNSVPAPWSLCRLDLRWISEATNLLKLALTLKANCKQQEKQLLDYEEGEVESSMQKYFAFQTET